MCSMVRLSPKTIFNGVLFTLSISFSQKSKISKLSPFADIEISEESLLLIVVKTFNVNGISRTEITTIDTRKMLLFLFFFKITFTPSLR